LNVVGNICHEKKYGFHPYALELSKLIRKGLLARGEALQKLSLTVEEHVTQEVFVQLNITVDEISQVNTRAA
jgi:hypothetical protein